MLLCFHLNLALQNIKMNGQIHADNSKFKFFLYLWTTLKAKKYHDKLRDSGGKENHLMN